MAEIEHRASALALTLTVRDEGQTIELVAPMGRRHQS